MEFEKRLEKAITRGQQTRDEESRQAADRALSEAELRSLHSTCRIELSEHIETCLRKLSEHFPGFRYETVVNEDGWGARIVRDDFRKRGRGRAENVFSRLEMLIRPFSTGHIVELVARGNIANKDALNRRHFQFLSQADVDSFSELIDLWVLEFAEKFAGQA